MRKDLFVDRKVVIFDVKTTEQDMKSEILHFASRTFVNNEMIAKENFFIKTKNSIDGYIGRKNRITNKKLESEGLEKEEALDRIAAIFQDAILFTYNGDNFLYPLFEKIFTENGYQLELSTIDALKLAKQIICFEQDFTLEELTSKLGIMYNNEKIISAPYCTILLEKIWFRLKSFIIN